MRRNQYQPTLPQELTSSSAFHEAEVIDPNWDKIANAYGRPLPVQHVFITMPWLASSDNPQPYSTHPVPVYVNQHHTPDRKDWEPLPPGTRVLVAEVDKVKGVNPLGLAVVAFGPPATDSVYPDLRETSRYSLYRGGEMDRIVWKDSDPKQGPNSDYGRDHTDASGYGWRTRLPYPSDPMRQEGYHMMPGYTVEYFDYKDDSDTHQSYTDRKGGGLNHVTYPTPKVEYKSMEDGVPPIMWKLDPVAQKVYVGREGFTPFKLPRWTPGPTSTGATIGLGGYLELLVAAIEVQFATKLDGLGSPAVLPKPDAGIPTEVVEVD